MINIKEGLVYDDVLLIPAYSDISSRSEVDLSVELPKGFKVNHPIIPANMSDTSSLDMSLALLKHKGLSIIHRFMPIEEQLDIVKVFAKKPAYLDDYDIPTIPLNYVGFSIGVKADDYVYAERLITAGAKILCIDIAHCDSLAGVNMCNFISKKYPDVLLIAGNIATGSGAKRLWEAGADIVKAGIGGGSLCTTRIETGNGVPQLTAIMEVAEMKTHLEDICPNKKYAFIADGGLSNAGNCCKALAFADLVMAGNLFSGCIESPSKPISIDGILYKEYSGSSTHKTNHIEGVRALVNPKGSVKDIISKLLDGISSGCSYQGVRNLTELKENPQFIRITNAGLIESHPHNVKVIK